MNDDELVKKVRAKYPQYASMDDASLVSKIRAKYPQYGESKPTIGQRIKSGASKLVTKAGGKITKELPFLKGGDTWPEIIGQTMGQVAGVGLGGEMGMFPAVAGGAIGSMAGTAMQDLPVNLLSLQYPKARKELFEKMKRSGARGATFAAAGETVPHIWRGAKAVGREFLGGISALSGVTDRVEQLRKLPIPEQIKVLNPFGKKIPTPEIAGAAQGAVEEKLGIPTLNQVTKERIYAEPKSRGGGVGGSGVPLKDIIASLGKGSKGAKYLEEQGLKLPAEVSSKTGESTPVMRKVAKAFAGNGEPSINDAVQALRDTHYRAGKLVQGAPEGPVYAEESEKINAFLERKISELMKARKLTHLANMRDELLHFLPKSPKGEPYRFGVMRLVWMLKTAISVLSGGMMSPWGSGAAAVGGDVLTNMLDPLLGKKFSGVLATGGLRSMEKRK